MAQNDRIGSNHTRMTADEIIQRGFSTKVRGISETEVRSFLKRVSEEVERLGAREDELTAKVASLVEELAAKPKATKAELLESLGEQTTRVLSSAEEAAEQMLADANAQSQSMLEKAKKESEEIMMSARAKAEQDIADAQSRVRSLQESSKRDAETVIAQSRKEGREIFQESVVVREQILKDLLRRRDLLLEQIEELRNGREELLESYKVVKGSFQKATDALHSVEEKASTELLSNPVDVDELLKAPVQLPSVLETNGIIPSSVYDQETKSDSGTEEIIDEVVADVESISEVKESDISSPEVKIISEPEAKDEISITGKRKTVKNYMKDALGVGEENEVIDVNETRVEQASSIASITPVVSGAPENSGAVTTLPKKKDVGALFQSLKSQGDNETKDTEQVDEIDLSKDEETQVQVSEQELEKATSNAKTQKSAKKKAKAQKDPVQKRDDVLAGVTTAILRKAKRQLQDEQNELLEALRTIKPKKRIAAENILPDPQTQLKTWEEAIRTELESVFMEGVSSVSSESFSYDQDALDGAVSWIITPLRETLTMAIDEGEQADATARVGARYREWRNSDLKNALYDALCSAYNNGVVTAAKNDATIKWNVEKAGQCPDCDDNALEPTQVGEAFPTGQVAPPAHSGCRCVITVA